jgi:phage terminase large subunit-like protein
MWSAITAILTSIMNGIGNLVAKIFRHKQDAEISEDLGKEKMVNEIHKDNAKRKEAADAVLREPTKSGKDLVDDLARRNADK